MVISVVINAFTADDFIIDCGSAPFLKRNKLLEPKPGSFNMVVSDLLLVQRRQQVLIKVDGTIRFSGYVASISHNYERHTYDLRVVSSLMKLKDVFIENKTLHTYFTVGATDNEYKASDNEGFPNVAILWALKQMFSKAQLTLDTTAVDDRVVESGGSYGTVREKDLVLDENMLYALNQPYAMNYRVFEAIYGNTNKAVNCLEFLQRICIGREFYIHPTSTADEYKLELKATYSSSNNYTVADSDKINYKKISVWTATYNYLKAEVKYGSDAVGGAAATIRALYNGINFATTDVNTTTDTITSNNHGLITDSFITFTTTGTLPGGITASNIYYVVNATTNTFQISTSRGGTAVNLTSAGSGTHTYYGQYELVVAESNGEGQTDVPLWNNFWIRYHASGTAVGDVQASQEDSTNLMDDGYADYYYYDDPIPHEQIETPSLDFTKYRMLEHYINVKKRTQTIKQALV